MCQVSQAMNPVKRLLRPIYAPPLRKLRNRAAMKKQQAHIRAQVAACASANTPLKIIIGAGNTRYPGWIATDIPALHVLKEAHWALLFQPASIHNMLAEHVFEHMTAAELSQFLRLARRYLAQGGRIRLAVPDGLHPDATYIDHVRPGGIGEGADDHKTLYTHDMMAKVLRACGYEFQLLEYFDAAGEFHQAPWQAHDGFISRSAGHDKRNQAGQLRYTSLIVDCWIQAASE